MTGTSAAAIGPGWIARSPRGAIAREGGGLGLLAAALLFGLVALRPEARIGVLPPNDGVFHFAAAERLAQGVTRGEPFLDPWVSEWSLGYPVWRSYQPLPHLLAAAVLGASRPEARAGAFAALQLALLVLFPANVYLGARLFGLAPIAAGLASILVLAPSGAGEFGRFGLGYGATVWRGSGLFTQLVALHVLVVALGLVVRALRSGRRRPLAAAFVALTALSHIIFGYVAGISALLLALVGSPGGRARRLVNAAGVGAGAAILVAWFAVPLWLSRTEVNHSRWEAAFKWDSFGAGPILRALVDGSLLDAGRWPVLTALVALGVAGAVLARRAVVSRRLLALTSAWLALFFGRACWGHVLLLLGVPRDLPLHRFQSAFELFACLLAAHGIERLLARAFDRKRAAGLALAAVVAAGVAALGFDRAVYLAQNAKWGEANLRAWNREEPELHAAIADVRALLAVRPGRVSAGPASTWGAAFRVGDVPVYAALTREHLDEVSFLYHAMSTTSDVMVLRDEANASHDALFGVRAVLAPSDRSVPPHYRLRGRHGRFAVYESSREGYFSLVDVSATYTGPAETAFEASSGWLRTPLPASGIVVSLDRGGPETPGFERWAPFPAPPPGRPTERGSVLSELKTGETYSARVRALRSCFVLAKITWFPGLRATVDGRPVPLIRVTPGFGAVHVEAGEHDVAVRFEPGPMKPVLLALGVLGFAVFAIGLRRRAFARVEERAVRLLTSVRAPRRRPVLAALAVAGMLAILAVRPLFRGALVDGHDALEYPPRLVEMARAVGDGQIPPVWAPDLGSGYGQPLFAFAPPLVYAAALPLRALGLGLANAVQLGLAVLVIAGGAAVFRLARRWGCGPAAAAASTAAWLFVPYLSLDLFVRAAYAEAAAIAVAPAALLFLLRALDRPSPRSLALAGAGVALVVLGHNAAALLLLPAFFFVVLMRAAVARSGRTLAAGAVSLAAGLALAAFFWVPALAEKGLVKTDLLREGFLRYRDHFATAGQLLWSPWGYGFSVAGPADGMSFAVGPLHVLLGAAGLVIAFRSREPRLRAEAAALGVVALGGAWLATPASGFLWDRAPFLQYLAFPWRSLLLPALSLPVLAGLAFERMSKRVFFASVATLALLTLPHTEPKGYLTFDDEYYAPARLASLGVNTTTREEYEPRWVERRPAFSSVRLQGRDAPVRILSEKIRSARQEFLVETVEGTTVDATTFAYPGWTVRIDGREVPHGVAPGRGTIRFEVPAGRHGVSLTLEPTRARRLATGLSLGAAVLLACATAVRRPAAVTPPAASP